MDFPALGGKRTMYAVPWRHTCLIGTTDTDYFGDLDSVHALPDEVDWILASVNQGFEGVNLTHADVISTYAGLRPLVSSGTAAAYRAPREHHITVAKSGLISIAGGKLTTHRAMAQEVVDLAAERLGRRVPCRTGRVPLDADAATPRAVAALEAGVYGAASEFGDEVAQHLVSTYGSDAWQVLRLFGEQPELKRPIVAGLLYTYAEVVHAVKHEMAGALTDVMIRRLRLIHEDQQQGLGLAADIAACMAPHLGWSASEIGRQVDAYRRQVALTRQFANAA